MTVKSAEAIRKNKFKFMEVSWWKNEKNELNLKTVERSDTSVNEWIKVDTRETVDQFHDYSS